MKSRTSLFIVLLFIFGCSSNTESQGQTTLPFDNGQIQTKETAYLHQPTAQLNNNDKGIWFKIISSKRIKTNIGIEDYIQLYSNDIVQVQSIINKAEPFIYIIQAQLERRNMPLELALLPFITSEYDIHKKTDTNAGLWQLNVDTAKKYGLSITNNYDARFDLGVSNHAAFLYLTQLYANSDNDWGEALKSYNDDETNLAKLLAIKEILSNYDKYGLTLPVVKNYPLLKRYRARTPETLEQIASAADISLSQLNMLNPSFKNKTLPNTGIFSVWLPIKTYNLGGTQGCNN